LPVCSEIIRKVYEVSPLLCPKCQGEMRIIAFITGFPVVDRIINHLKLTFTAAKPPPARMAYQELLMAGEAGTEYFSCEDNDLCFISLAIYSCIRYTPTSNIW